jgi:prolipoprotein diacylglyceryl transferase
MLIHALIPSPPEGVWHLGPVPIRAYALCIIAGVVVAVWLSDRRWVARGGNPGTVADVAVWAVPFGLVGARLYHVVTDYQLYFGPGRDPWRVFAVWEGGLGIWGGVALGAVGAWIACRRRGIPLPAMADAAAPGVVLAQAIGRWGNWFNQELFGAPTSLPWGLRIDPAHRPDGYEQYEAFHPTFLYESVWNVGVAGLVIWADRRFRLGHGRAFALYVAGYTAGRGWIEYLRIDPVNHLAGLRLNVWTSIVVFLAAVVYIVVSARLRPGREMVSESAEELDKTEADKTELEEAPAVGEQGSREDHDPTERHDEQTDRRDDAHDEVAGGQSSESGVDERGEDANQPPHARRLDMTTPAAEE